MAKLLVTGGAGFIGGHLVRHGLAQGHQLVVLDDLSTGRLANLADLLAPDSPVARSGQLRFVNSSLNDATGLGDALDGVEVVLHQAAIPSVPRSVADPLGSNHANITGTLNLLDAAREAGVRRVVMASSSSVYGDTPVSPKHEGLPLAPKSPYAVQKATLELYARAYSGLYELDTACLRYFNVFGPRQDPKSQYAAAIPAFVTAILNDRPPTVYGDGEQTRDFTFIANVVHANYLAAFADRRIAGAAMNIACGESISVNQVIAAINRILGKSVRSNHLPSRAGDVRDSLAAIDRAKELIGFTPQVGFADGLAQSIEWYKSNSK